jgi:hypothetical protein
VGGSIAVEDLFAVDFAERTVALIFSSSASRLSCRSRSVFN